MAKPTTAYRAVYPDGSETTVNAYSPGDAAVGAFILRPDAQTVIIRVGRSRLPYPRPPDSDLRPR